MLAAHDGGRWEPRVLLQPWAVLVCELGEFTPVLEALFLHLYDEVS